MDIKTELKEKILKEETEQQQHSETKNQIEVIAIENRRTIEETNLTVSKELNRTQLNEMQSQKNKSLIESGCEGKEKQLNQNTTNEIQSSHIYKKLNQIVSVQIQNRFFNQVKEQMQKKLKSGSDTDKQKLFYFGMKQRGFEILKFFGIMNPNKAYYYYNSWRNSEQRDFLRTYEEYICEQLEKPNCFERRTYSESFQEVIQRVRKRQKKLSVKTYSQIQDIELQRAKQSSDQTSVNKPHMISDQIRNLNLTIGYYRKKQEKEIAKEVALGKDVEELKRREPFDVISYLRQTAERRKNTKTLQSFKSVKVGEKVFHTIFLRDGKYYHVKHGRIQKFFEEDELKIQKQNKRISKTIKNTKKEKLVQ